MTEAPRDAMRPMILICAALMAIVLVIAALALHDAYVVWPRMERFCVQKNMGYLIEYRTGEYCVEINGTRHRIVRGADGAS